MSYEAVVHKASEPSGRIGAYHLLADVTEAGRDREEVEEGTAHQGMHSAGCPSSHGQT